MPLTFPRPFIAAPDVYSVAMQYTSFDQPVLNIYHVHTVFTAGADPMPNIASLFQTWNQTDLRPTQCGGVTLNKITVRDLGTQNGKVYELPVSTNNQGSLVDTELPNNVTIALKWTTGYAGRSNRGRTFHIGIGQAQVVNERIIASYQTALLAAYQGLLNRVAGTPALVAPLTAVDLVVLSYSTNNAWRLSGAVYRKITGVTLVDTVVDNQRRRLPAHNRHR